MNDDEVLNEPDIVISGPDGGDAEGTRIVLLKRHVYRVDFEADGEPTRCYVASNDKQAIRFAEHDRPGAIRTQVSRVHRDVIVGVKVRVNAAAGGGG